MDCRSRFPPFEQPYGKGHEPFANSLSLPRNILLLHAKRFDPTILAIADKMGDSRRTIQDLQYCQCDGTGYFAGTLTGSETVTSKQGTAAVTFASGRMNVGAGTLWSVVLSNGSRYEFATLTSESTAIMFDVSGNGRHLEAVDFSDLGAMRVTSKTQGSDWLNQYGYTTADGTQYMHPVSFGLIPSGTLIPAAADGSGSVAYSVGGV